MSGELCNIKVEVGIYSGCLLPFPNKFWKGTHLSLDGLLINYGVWPTFIIMDLIQR